ncbi:MAG: putative zinc-binding metallopeptidase [Phycisphaeraceae bacterium]
MASRSTRTGRGGRFWWVGLPDDELLDLRLSDLKVRVAGTELDRRVGRLYDELERKGLSFRPHTWLSSEWFSPDGVPGIAMPFYLAHPRLVRLEQKQMLAAEGAKEQACMKLLRHEAGHCIDTAYRLHRRKRWRALFGSFTEPYPDFYRPRPRSRDYVLHLDGWYAQAHPAEDFAETFAVWLQPGSRWRQRYRTWPALRKLAYVDELMVEIAGTPPPVRSRRQVEPVGQLKRTLGEHYRLKRMHYADDFPDFYDSDLRRIFSDEPRYVQRETAASFLRRHRAELRRRVAAWTDAPPYTIDQVLRDMIDRCKELKLRLALSQSEAQIEAVMLVTVQTMYFLQTGRRVAV